MLRPVQAEDQDWCKDLSAHRRDIQTEARMDRESVLESDSGLVWASVREWAWGCHRDSDQLSGTRRARHQTSVKSIQTNQTLLETGRIGITTNGKTNSGLRRACVANVIDGPR